MCPRIICTLTRSCSRTSGSFTGSAGRCSAWLDCGRSYGGYAPAAAAQPASSVRGQQGSRLGEAGRLCRAAGGSWAGWWVSVWTWCCQVFLLPVRYQWRSFFIIIYYLVSMRHHRRCILFYFIFWLSVWFHPDVFSRRTTSQSGSGFASLIFFYAQFSSLIDGNWY